jgi:hypothetical protein
VHHWGKPLYTTLCAPFAQLGFQGAITFNILCGLLTSLLIYRIVKLLQYRNAVLVVPFAVFTPIYMVTMMTGLTEILFGLVLVAGIYFFLKQKSILSAVIISFIPYARTEGIMFLVIFLLAFVMVRKFKAIPFLLTGFIIYSAAGYFHYKDLLWFFTALPYGEKGSQLYGSGSFWYYIERFPRMMGYPLLVMALMGLVIMISGIFRDKNPKLEFKWISEYYLVIGSFFAFLLVHSFLWWKGMMGVLSNEMFMACILPLGGIFALSGFNWLIRYFEGKRILKISVTIVISGLVLWMPYYFYDIPAPLVRQDKVMKETAEAVRKLGYKDRKVLFFDPKFAFFLGEDPYDRSKLFFRLSDDKRPEFNQPDGTLLIWDAYFAEVEKKLLLDDLVRNTKFKLIDGYIPEKDFSFAGKQNYVSFIFEKRTSTTDQNEWILNDSNAYKTAPKVEKERFLSDSVAFTGQKSVRLNPDSMYSFTLEKELSGFKASKKAIVRGRAKVF